MKTAKTFLSLVLLFLLMNIVSAGGKVLFYETKATYKTDVQYSQFKEELQRRGYVVSKLEIPLSKTVLKRNQPDVLVLPGLASSLTPTEKAAVFEFVMQQGKGLFICGGTPAANELSIPFGMTLDDAPLEDETNAIDDDKEKFSLSYANNFVPAPGMKSIVQGVTQLGFFGGSGISLSGNAKAVVIGDWDTYAPKSSTGMFPKGSKPPLAAGAVIGKGLVFLLSDGSMLADSNLEKYPYDNLKFGANIVDWLSISLESTQNTSLDELRVIIGSLQQQNSRLNATLTERNKKIEELLREKSRLTSQLSEANDKIAKMEAQSFFGIKYWIWAMALLGVAIIVLSVVVSKKLKEIPGLKKVSQLGYELGKEKPEEEKTEEKPLEIGGGKLEEDFLEEPGDFEEEKPPESEEKES